MSQLEARMLVHAIASHRVTLGALVNCVPETPSTLLQRVRAMVRAGALELSVTSDESQLAVAPGRPEAVAPYAEHDPSGAIAGWLQLIRTRTAGGAQHLRTRSEFDTVASRYNARARAAVALLAVKPPEQGRAWLELTLAICRELAAQGKPMRILAARNLCEQSGGRVFVDQVTDLGIPLHLAPRVDASFILWEQLGAVHFVQGRMQLGVDEVGALGPLVDVWFDASEPTHQVTRSRVVRLLAQGHTDAVAARKLGISERQFRRHVSGLMQDLEASSRFQAGIEAARSMQW